MQAKFTWKCKNSLPQCISILSTLRGSWLTHTPTTDELQTHELVPCIFLSKRYPSSVFQYKCTIPVSCMNLTLVYLRLSFRFVYCLVVWLASLLHTHTADTWSNEWKEEKKRYPNSLWTNTRKYCLCKRSIDDDNVVNMRTNSYCVVYWRRKKILLCLGFCYLFNSWICLGRFFYVLEKRSSTIFRAKLCSMLICRCLFLVRSSFTPQEKKNAINTLFARKKTFFLQISLKWLF